MEDDYKRLNTIYIISKGRPQCTTAKTLTRMKYPGEWFIVNGSNDETHSEYVKNWGKDRVLAFDFEKEIENTDTMDNFGFEDKPSGAVPVRNATIDMARKRGEVRHWQFDDDYTGFMMFDRQSGKNRSVDGEKFQRELLRIAKLGETMKMPNIGFSVSTIEANPQKRACISRRVFNAHNLATDPELVMRWRGRMNDDLINALDVCRTGGLEIQFKYMMMTMKPTQQEAGGLTELYKSDGAVRKTAYAVLAMPQAVRLVRKFGRYHHKVDWKAIAPKILRGK